MPRPTLFAKPFLALLSLLALNLLATGPLHAQNDGPTYSVTLSAGSFSPNPIGPNSSATATVTGTLVITNPDDEHQVSDEKWSWGAFLTGYKTTKDSGYGQLPPSNLPTVTASQGSSTTTITVSTAPYISPGAAPPSSFNNYHHSVHG